MTKSTQSGGLASLGFSMFLGTQFLGAFNDNAFKFLVIGFAMSRLSPEEAKNYVPLASSLFIVPFLLFSSIAGYLSDRFTKKQVMVWTKILEVLIMLAGFWMLYAQQTYWVLLVLFFMGAQSTLFSPAKYGYLPETLKESALSAGNGLVQLFTFLAIIAGGGVGSHLAERFQGEVFKGTVVCIAVAAVGVLASFGIGRTKDGDPKARLSLDPLFVHVKLLKMLCRDPLLRFSIIGCTYFWLVATVIQSNIPIVVKQDLGLGDASMGYLQAALALGIGVGSALAGALSRGKIAYHFVVPAGMLLGVMLVVCGSFSGSLAAALVLNAVLGATAGFYQIPLASGIQQRSPENLRGASLAACNVLDCLSMLVGTGIHWVLLNGAGLREFLGGAGLNGCGVLVVMGVLTVLFSCGLAYLKNMTKNSKMAV